MTRFKIASIFAALILSFQVTCQNALAESIEWRTDIAAAAAAAKSSNKFMFVEVSAPWCPACRRLEKLMDSKKIAEWTNPRFVCVHLSADAPGGKALMSKFGLHGIPALFVFNPDGKIVHNMSGAPNDVERFKNLLAKLAGGEAALANAGNSGSDNPAFPAQSDPGWSNGTAEGNTTAEGANGTAGGVNVPSQNSFQQGSYPQQPQQSFSQQSQQGYPQQPQQGYQAPPTQNYLPPAPYQQNSYAQPYPQGQAQGGYPASPTNGSAPQQQYPQSVMQWQGPAPTNPPINQFQQAPQNQYQQGQQQFQQQYQQQMLGPRVQMNPIGGPNQYPLQNQYAPIQNALPVQNAAPTQYAQPNQYAQPTQFAQPNQYAHPNQYGQPAQYAQPNQFTQPNQVPPPPQR